MLKQITLIVLMNILLSACGVSNHDPQSSLRAYEAPRVPPAGTVPVRPLRHPLGQVDRALLEKGQKLYEINCSVCHGLDGSGEGIVTLRGLTGVVSFMDHRLRDVPASHIHEVISMGRGRMPSYARRLEDQERWAVALYVKALQLSRQIHIKELEERDRRYFDEEVAP